MKTQKLEALNFDPHVSHEENISIEGLEDLFQWASDVVADGITPANRRNRDSRIHRTVLDLIQRNKEYEAREKVSEELNYLNRRLVALLQVISDKLEQQAVLKQILLTQYLALQQIPVLEAEVKELREKTEISREDAEERQHLLDVVTKLKVERDFLEELVTSNESENKRLSILLCQTRRDLQELQSRKWWHPLAALIRKLITAPATA